MKIKIDLPVAERRNAESKSRYMYSYNTKSVKENTLLFRYAMVLKDYMSYVDYCGKFAKTPYPKVNLLFNGGAQRTSTTIEATPNCKLLNNNTVKINRNSFGNSLAKCKNIVINAIAKIYNSYMPRTEPKLFSSIKLKSSG